MSATEILTELSEIGVQVWAEEGQLRLRSPAGALGDSMRARLSKHKAELLDILDQRQKRQEEAALPTIVPEPEKRHEPFALTDIQRAYWVGRQEVFDLGDVSIHFYTEVDCHGLDMERLTLAWNKVVARHDMLRAVVLEDGNQQILPKVPHYEIPEHDLRGRPAEEVATQLEEIREELSHLIDPTDEWPGFRLSATHLDEERTRLHLSLDLLHVDGASILIICQDLVKLYQDLSTPFEPLEFSYRDYVLAEQRVSETEHYRAGLEYWRRRIVDLPPAPDLPLAKQPNALESTRFVRRNLKVEREVYEALKKRATEKGITPSVVFLIAFSEIIGAWCKSRDFTLNVTLFNRLPVHPQVHQIVGDFTSMILLGVHRHPGERLIDRAKRLQQQLWEDFEHRDVSGVTVLGELNKLNKQHAGGVMPIVYTSLLDLESQGFSPDMLDALGDEVFTITQTPQLYLDHQLKRAADGGVDLSMDVVMELFPAGMLDSMFAAYGRLIERLAREEGIWESDSLCVVPESDLTQRRADNKTAVPIPEETLYSLFRAQAEKRSADHLAVISSSKSLTYDELLRRSSRLGHRLRQLGAAPETMVAVVMEKGWEQVVGAVGIHAAGAAYLPIDPALPNERRFYLFERSEVRIAVTQSWIEDRLDWPEEITRICVDTDDLAPASELDGPLEPVQGPRNLSHVIYTSGSTGKPKGVMIEHRNVVNRMLDINGRFDIGPEDRALALTALHHDLSVFDIFGVLAAGAGMVIPDEARRRDPGHWLELMDEHRVTLWNSVPAFLEMLMEYVEGDPSRESRVPDSLRWVIMAGDWIPVSLPGRLRAQVADVDFIASGGPTETTIWDIWNRVEEVDPEWKSIPYGKPLANARYHVLDYALEPRPVWVPGELYIAGDGLARGYWRDVEKTAEKFLIHPRSGERIYRSGDWGRYLPDGNIEFMGREDFQVKIHGQRIELGEIETAFTDHPAVRAAVATVADTAKGRQLVAYVVAQRGAVQSEAAEAPGQAAISSVFEGVEGIEVTDPLERLEHKLAYPALRDGSTALRSIELERGKSPADSLRSQRKFDTVPISRTAFGEWMSSLAYVEENGLHKYRYGSGGGLYPVQVYLHVKPDRIEGIPGGAYYYHPGEHRLDLLSEAEGFGRSVHFAYNQVVFDEAAFSIFLIGELAAVEPLYGDLAREFCLLEAGMMTQVLRESAPLHDLGICSMGTVRFDQVRELFGLGESQILVHNLLAGKVAEPAREESGGGLSAAELQSELLDFVRQELPDHMVPTAVQLLDELPLTANGKVDRKSLPSIESLEQDLASSFEPPANELEETIVSLWQELLEIDQIGVNHNFFDLGANSMLVVKMYRQLREILKKDFPLISMFRHPTTKALADFLSDDAQKERTFEKSQKRAATRREMRKRRQRAIKKKKE